MDFEQKVEALQEMKREVGQELERRFCEVLELADRAGVLVLDDEGRQYCITDFTYDPDLDQIKFSLEAC